MHSEMVVIQSTLITKAQIEVIAPRAYVADWSEAYISQMAEFVPVDPPLRTSQRR